VSQIEKKKKEAKEDTWPKIITKAAGGDFDSPLTPNPNCTFNFSHPAYPKKSFPHHSPKPLHKRLIQMPFSFFTHGTQSWANKNSYFF
jgi:hypothetical protein